MKDLTVAGRDNSDTATNRGSLAQTVEPLGSDPNAGSEANRGDSDVRSFPSNGAIPDQVRSLVPSPGYHVP